MAVETTSNRNAARARAETRVDGATLTVSVGGDWGLRGERPDVDRFLGAADIGEGVKSVAIEPRDLGAWDSALVLFVLAVREWAQRRGLSCSWRTMPAALDRLIAQFDAAQPAAVGPRPYVLLTTRIGIWATHCIGDGRVMLRFLGECVLAFGRIHRNPWPFRWRDTIEQMRRCGSAALPIVGLISALVGVIMGFVGAVQLRPFGADIYIADLVGLAVVREMGPMMAAIVLAGRTGAAFAAELGNMKLGEEIDALETFGVRGIDFLVVPRLIALVAMMPLLALYADFLGVIGGMFVAQGVLDLAPAAFFTQLQGAIGLSDLGTGLLKSLFFGWIVAYSGCFRGMRAERSSVGVGTATTSAVVTGILLIIIADAIFTVLFTSLGW